MTAPSRAADGLKHVRFFMPASIPRSRRRSLERSSQTIFAIVTILDSTIGTFAMKALRGALESGGFQGTDVLGALGVPVPALRAIADPGHGLFNGFDEVWLFRRKPVRLPPARITGDLELEVDELREARLPEWMLESSCVLGLGDGAGMNVLGGDDQMFHAFVRGSARS